MNLSGTLNAFRLFREPSICLPHHTIPTFEHLSLPLGADFARRAGQSKPNIKAVILDKDNCFAIPHTNEVYPQYKAKFEELRKAYPGSRLLIVSNTAGTASDPGGREAEILEKNTGVRVFRHNVKKPGCHQEILEYFRNDPDAHVTSPAEIAVVGDRLLTDMMLANMMGSYGIFVRDGVTSNRSLFSTMELSLSAFLQRRGVAPPNPVSDFEQ